MNRIRREKLKEYIENKGVATTKELRELLPEVSLMTLHRDLDVLESQGILHKYHGGVRSVRQMGDEEFDVRMRDNNPGKLAMAQKALTLLQPHSSVFLDAGTSNIFLARNMPDINLNIITTSPGIALELCKLKSPVITLCCGTLNRNNKAISGQNTLEMLKNINIDTAFIGVSGCSTEGFTCGTEGDMLVKRLVIQKARTTVMMCSSEKLTRLMPYTFARMEDADYIITDKPMPKEFVEMARESKGVIL